MNALVPPVAAAARRHKVVQATASSAWLRRSRRLSPAACSMRATRRSLSGAACCWARPCARCSPFSARVTTGAAAGLARLAARWRLATLETQLAASPAALRVAVTASRAARGWPGGSHGPRRFPRSPRCLL
jgi:hypothetical protein